MFKEIVTFILKEGKNITREVLEEKLQEAYNQGREDALNELSVENVETIRFNVLRKIKNDKRKLSEDNFYNTPKDEDVIQMKALDYLEKNIKELIK